MHRLEYLSQACNKAQRGVHGRSYQFGNNQRNVHDPFRPQALQQRSGPLVGALRRHYQPELQRDPDLGELLDAVEETYCGERRGGGGMDGMLGGLMQMLGGGGPGMLGG